MRRLLPTGWKSGASLLLAALGFGVAWSAAHPASTTPPARSAPPTSTIPSTPPPPEPVPLGFSGRDWERERALEHGFQSYLDAGRISSTHRELTKEPHHAGTEGGRRVALLIKQAAERAGFKPEVVPYLFYNSHPGPLSIALTAPSKRPLTLAEDRIPGDPFTARPQDHPAYCAYSGSGTAEGEVVYAGQGSVEEFRILDEQRISLKGRVALMRYFGAGEGEKVLRAQERGAVAVVLYADPLEDGFVQGTVYPKGNWRPAGSIMRRTLIDTPYEGDALTPGWAATSEAKRLDPKSVKGLPKIPVLPISYRDAGLVLSHLEGPPAPERMQGGLLADGAGRTRLVYRLGPGPARLKLSVRMTESSDTIRDVIVRIPGREEPDSWVILGNHHDAWIYGAGDPSSGTAAQIEVLRALGRMRQAGWRPRRTLIVAFWDAEELNLGGSAEWAEDQAQELRRHGAAVINMDSAVFNTERPLYVTASPTLHRLFLEVARQVRDPRGRGSLWETWLRQQNETRGLPSTDAFGADFDASHPLAQPHIDPIPLGDDQTPFVEYLALPGSDMYYGADYGMYHSLYENRHWMETVVDPKFLYHRLMAEFQGTLALRLVMAPVLPLDATGTARAWESAFEALEEKASEAKMSPRVLRPVKRALKRFRQAADDFAAARDEALSNGAWERAAAAPRRVEVNRELAAVERSFFAPDGLPGFPWYRGLWVAPPRAVPGLDDARLPGLRWPLELGQEGTLGRQVDVYATALDEAAAHLHRAEGLLQTLAQPR